MDKHHTNCEKYLNDNSHSFFISDTVEQEYQSKKSALSRRFSSGIQKHIASLKRSGLSGNLGPMDQNQIESNIIPRSDIDGVFASIL